MAGVLSVLTLASRIPFAGQFLFNSDSTRFALAMEHFDVSQMRPHAPGYILYVASAKLIDLFVHDARASLVGVNILASALTVVVLYFLSLRMFGRTSAVISSVLLASSPLFWFNGEMALTYALEGFFCTLFAYVCFLMVKGEKKWTLISAVLLAIATGIRQNVVIFFLPLWFFSIRKSSLKKIFVSFLFYGLVCLGWFLPLVILSGGLKSYFQTLEAQFRTVVLHPAPFLFEIIGRGMVLARFMLYSLTIGILPILYHFGQFFRPTSIVRDRRLQFILLWMIAPVLFYFGVTLYNPGQVIVILPPLFMLLAESLAWMAGDLAEAFKAIVKERSSRISHFLTSVFTYKSLLISSAGLVILFNIAQFILMRTPVSYAAIKTGDGHLSELIRLSAENVTLKKTMILACQMNTQAAYYLPEVMIYCPFPLIFSGADVPIEAQNVYISHHHQTNPKIYWQATGFRIEPIPISDGIDTLLVWENDVAGYYQNFNRPMTEIRSDRNDARIYLLQVHSPEKLYYDFHYWTVK